MFSSICIGNAVNFPNFMSPFTPPKNKVSASYGQKILYIFQHCSRHLSSSASCTSVHSLGLFADLLHQLLDVIFHELNFFLLASQRLLQTDNSIHKHSLVDLWEAVHDHHRRTRLALWWPLFNTTVPTMACIQGAWGRGGEMDLEKLFINVNCN